ncbi:MAG: hypothetical protein ACFFCS_08195 [Candidatus Hodarchaeota archaeon]
MSHEKDLQATYLMERGKKFQANGKNMKAVKQFLKAAEIFEQIANKTKDESAWDLVINNLVDAAKCLLDEGAYIAAAKLQGKLANLYLSLGNYNTAADYYNVSAKYLLKDKNVNNEAPTVLRLAAMYSFLQVLQAEYNKAWSFLKKILGMFDSMQVVEYNLFSVIKDFYKAILKDKPFTTKLNKGALAKEGLTDEEIKIIDYCSRIKKLIDNSEFTFTIKDPEDGKVYLEGETICSTLSITVAEDKVLGKKNDKLEINSILVDKSNDLAIEEEFKVPCTIDFRGHTELQKKFKSYYAGENELGPLLIEMHYDDFIIKKSLPGIKFKVHGQPTYISVNFEELQEPMIGKSFPVRVEVANESRGSANNLEVNIVIPEDDPIHLVRGTLTKKVYSLGAGESTAWDIKLKPLEEGTFNLKVLVTFKDADGKSIGPIENNVPLEIKI